MGVLYHGCDDVGDQRGLEALGGGGEEDIRDGILTLPAALAIRDPGIRELFLRDDHDPQRLKTLAAACVAQVEEAERVLDTVAEEDFRAEAMVAADDPEPLLVLVEEVRQLSRVEPGRSVLGGRAIGPCIRGLARSSSGTDRSSSNQSQSSLRRVELRTALPKLALV